MTLLAVMGNAESPQQDTRPSGARFVALGMMVSRLFGLVRQIAIARFFGISAHGDVWQNAIRLPNALQNLLGEQSLSAGFIPVYSRMLAQGRREEAGRFAGAVFSLLVAVVSAVVLAGVVFARPIVMIGGFGFLDDAAEVAAGTMDVDRLELTIRAVRITFPMTGFLVLSAWALGVLNSHRRFLLPYMAPAMWNVAIITILTATVYRTGFLSRIDAADPATIDRWIMGACWGGLLGGLLQFLVQGPLVVRLLRGLRPSLKPLAVPGVREALRIFGPALLGRGVVQLSLYVSVFLANFLAPGAPAAINYAVILMNLPLGAFGTSVAAAELPELSRLSSGEASKQISRRLDRAVRQSAFVLCPSVVGYLAFGYLVVGLIFLGGRFDAAAHVLAYVVLAAYSVGLLASAVSRILQNTFFALSDSRTPARIAAVRLVVDVTLGVGFMLWLDRYSLEAAFGPFFGIDATGLFLGAAGLALGQSIGSWVELFLLRTRLRRKLPGLRLPVGAVARLLTSAVLLALPAAAAWILLPAGLTVTVQALVVLPLYPVVYLGLAWWRSSPELELWIGRLWGRKNKKTT